MKQSINLYELIFNLPISERKKLTKRSDIFNKINGKPSFLFSWDMTYYDDVIEEWENLVPFKYNKCFGEFFIGFYRGGYIFFKYPSCNNNFKRFETFTELCDFLTTIDS